MLNSFQTIDNWSINLDELIESEISYFEVFSENSFFKEYFNSTLLKNLYQNKYISSADDIRKSDITFILNGKRINCNQKLLMIKSQEFKRIIQKSQSDKIKIDDLNPDAFKIMIDYLYFDEII